MKEEKYKKVKILILLTLIVMIGFFLYCVYGAGTLGNNLGV
jgi:hypothetical protein